jgi:hypothetical protein
MEWGLGRGRRRNEDDVGGIISKINPKWRNQEEEK